MNKLYILGALAVAGADAYVAFTPTPGHTLAALIGTSVPVALNPAVGGSYTYIYSGDCLGSGALTTLGMNNNYYQYYSATIAGGTRTFTAASVVVTYVLGTTATPFYTVAHSYKGCWHAHIYNWIAMPSMTGSGAVTSVTNGFGSAVSGYGYSMVGTATTDCKVSTIVTTDIFVSTGTLFKGGMFQSSAMTVSSADAISTDATLPVWGTHGPGYFATTVGTPVIKVAPTGVGLALATGQNSYWDFMQSSTIQGLTTLGRGGGTLGTGPCGWYVGYFYEAPARGVAFAVDAFNVADAAGGITLNFWTDNSVLKAASAFVVAGLAGLLF